MAEASVNFGTGISNAFSNVATFIPKFIVFLIILIVGYFIAKALEKLVARILTRIGFDQLAERGGIKTALSHSKYDASDILAKIVYYAVILFVLDVAFGVFGSNPISGFLHGLIAYLPLLFIAVVIIVVTAAIASVVRNLIENSLSGCPTPMCWATSPGASSWPSASSLPSTSSTSPRMSSTPSFTPHWPPWLVSRSSRSAEAASRQCPSGGKLSQPDTTQKSYASSAPEIHSALPTRQVRLYPPIPAVPPPSQMTEATTPPAPAANSQDAELVNFGLGSARLSRPRCLVTHHRR